MCACVCGGGGGGGGVSGSIWTDVCGKMFGYIYSTDTKGSHLPLMQLSRMADNDTSL